MKSDTSVGPLPSGRQ